MVPEKAPVPHHLLAKPIMLRTMVGTRPQAEDEWERTFNTLPDLVAILDCDHRIVRVNRAMAERLGRTVEECVGLRCCEGVHGLSNPPSFCPHTLTCHDGQQHTAEVHEPGLGGDFLVSTTPLRDSQGQVIGAVHVARDITARKRAEESVRAAHELLAGVLDTTPMLVACMDRDFNFLVVNRAYAQADEREPEFFPGKNHFALYPHAENEAVFRRVVETGEPYRVFAKPYEYKEHPERGVTYWDWSVAPIKDASGRVDRLVMTLLDVTPRIRDQQALRQSQADLNRAQAVARAGSWRLDVRRNELVWSEECHRIFGIPLGTPLRYETFLAVVHPEDRAYVDHKWRAALAGEPYDIEHRIVVGDQVKWVRERAELEWDAEGSLQGGFGTALDITERRRQEQRLQLLSEVTSQLLASDQPQQVVESLCRKVMDHLGCHAFFNYLVDDEPQRLRLNACAGIPEETARQIEWLDVGGAVCGCVARDGYRIVAEHIQTTVDPRTDLVRSLGIQAYACHPLIDQGQVIGTLSFGSRSKATFSDDDLTLMKTVAEHVAIAMQRIRLLESSKRHAEAAEAASVAKSQFLASMSHELRTPMNAILGMTDLALSEPLPPAVRDYLQTAKESADLLLELLNEVLDFSRIEAGRFELEATPFSLRQTIEQVIKTLGVRAYEKGLELVYDLPDSLPGRVVGDPLRLRQVLLNLVGNAIKFTQRGEVVLQVREASRVDSPSTLGSVVLEFSVSDTGIGIPPEDQERIFSPFTQADASTTRQYGGSGLGLAIAQKLVALMGGRIWVESQPGQGSTFFFTVRLPIHAQAGPGEPGLPDREAFRDLPVLVVADSATSRRILEQILASWTMRVETAADVPTALTKIHQAAATGQNYRVVLTDAVMPGINGFSLAEWLRHDDRLAGQTILMLSASDRQNYPEQCRGLKAQGLEKPISRSALFNAIAQALGTGGPASTPGTNAATAPLAVPSRALRVLLAEDTPANQKLVQHLLSKRGHTITVAPNGQQALELLREQDFDVVLMDVQMPVLDGYQATQAIRKLDDPKKAAIPIIAMTAHALKGDDERCLAAGMDAYLSKPIKGEELIGIVERLAGSEPPAAADQPARALGEAVVATVGFDLEGAVSKCFGKYDLFRDMVDCLFEETGPLVERMLAAVAHDHPGELAQAAHRLKGTVVYLNAQPVVDACQRLEGIGASGDLSAAAEAVDELQRQLALLQEILEPHRKKVP
jgi:PAS domain S-box-containing protein